MQYEKIFELLARSDVTELAFQTDRPPCALVNGAYKAVLDRNLSEEEVVAALVEAGGRSEVLQLLSGHRRWDTKHPNIGTLRVQAGYVDDVLQGRISRVGPPVQAQPRPPTAEERERMARGSVSVDEAMARKASVAREPGLPGSVALQPDIRKGVV